MKLSEISSDTGSFVVDMMIHYLEQGKKLYADIDGDMGTMPFYGEIEEVRPGPGGVSIVLTTTDRNDMNDDFNPAQATFDQKYTLKSINGKITLVDLKS
jgi:hypothetical protein